MKMMTRAEKEGVRERRRGKGTEENKDMDPKHFCCCANDSQDHNRLPVPRSKQALSRRLQVPAPTKKTCSTVRLFGPCFKKGRTRSEKTRARGDTCTSRERSHSKVPLDRERLQGPSVPAALGVPLELDRSFVPVLRPTGTVRPMPRSRSRAPHGKVAQLM